MHLLLIEDDLTSDALHAGPAEGFSCEWLRRAQDALSRWPKRAQIACCWTWDCRQRRFDLLRRWRRSDDATPVIVITARTALEPKLAGLDGGADDVVLKPFAVPELVSRASMPGSELRAPIP